jgi:hypothetical protein
MLTHAHRVIERWMWAFDFQTSAPMPDPCEGLVAAFNHTNEGKCR